MNSNYYRYGWVCFFDQWQRYYYPVLFLWSYLRLLCGTKFLRVLIFFIFAVFPAIRKNMFPQIRITANSFPAKIYSRLNILQLEFATQRYSTKKSSLFNHNLSKTTKYLFIIWKYVFLLHLLNKNENIIMLGPWYFLKIAKISSRKHKKSPKRKNFVPHGILRSMLQ